MKSWDITVYGSAKSKTPCCFLFNGKTLYTHQGQLAEFTAFLLAALRTIKDKHSAQTPVLWIKTRPPSTLHTTITSLRPPFSQLLLNIPASEISAIAPDISDLSSVPVYFTRRDLTVPRL